MGAGAWLVFKVNKYFSFNPFYFIEAKPPNGKPEREERLTLGARFVTRSRNSL